MTEAFAAPSQEDALNAVAFSRALWEGDGDGAALLSEVLDAGRLLLAQADLIGELVRTISELCGEETDETWTWLAKAFEDPDQPTFVRKRHQE